MSNTESRKNYDRARGDLEKALGPSARALSGPASSRPASETAKPEPTESIQPASLKPAESRICVFCQTRNTGRYQGADEECRGCRGPLRCVDLTAGHASRREAWRIEHHADIHYWMDALRPGATPGRVVDLSPTGLRFLSRQRLTPGCVIKIESPTLSAVATVTRSLPENTTGVFSTGVRFLTLRLGRPRGTFVSECA